MISPSKLRTLLTRFLNAKRAAGRSDRTIDWYEYLNIQFINSLPNKFEESALTEHIEKYQTMRRRQGVSASSVAAEYRAIRAWLRWCAKRELLKKDPTRHIETPQIPDRKPAHVTPETYFRLLDWMNHQIWRDGTWIDYRDRLIMQILFLTGLRVAEVIAIRHQDIDLGVFMLHVPKGKGDKARDVPISHDLSVSIVEYIKARPLWHGEELLVSDNGHGAIRGHLTIDGLRQMLKRRCKESATPYMSPHKWRHAFGMWALNSHIDATIVSKTMGHANVDFTMKYYARWLNGNLHDAYTKGLRNMERSQNR